MTLEWEGKIVSLPLISNEKTVKRGQMIIRCPHCGDKVVVRGLGWKPLNIPLKNVYECLRKYRDAARAAKELGCSQGYIFKALKANGLKLKDVFK